MTRTAILLGLLLAASTPCVAGGPVSERARHFRLEVGIRNVVSMAGWIDESGGTGRGYDRLALDVDGDGGADVVSDFEPDDPDADRWSRPTLEFRHERTRWSLELNGASVPPPRASGEPAEMYIGWSVQRGEMYAWFINGTMRLHASARAAARAPAVRLGRPFRIESDVTIRGPRVFFTAALRDRNGCTLRLAGAGRREANLRLVVLEDERAVLRQNAEYG